MNRWQLWVLGWIDIVVGLIVVLSLGRLTPSWELSWCIYATMRNQQRLIKKQKEMDNV